MMLAENLRKSILQSAIQGKLTKQLKEDGRAKDILCKIAFEKEKLVIDKNARKDPKFPEISDEEKPFEIPESWEWIRIGELGVYKKGPFGSALTKSMFIPKAQDTIKVYEQKNAIQKNANIGDYYISKDYFEKKMKGFEVFPNDIIVSCAGTIGETFQLPDGCERGIINQALMKMNIVNTINIKYFLLYFDFILKESARKTSKGSAIKNIPPFEIFKMMLFPVPPVKEQQRIVDKVEEIMKKIDEYEKYEEELKLIKESFPSDMKKSLLQAAIQGKLTEQLSEDSSVDELINKIKEEKNQLINDKKIKKEKKLEEIKADEILFDIPESWRWVKLGDLCLINMGQSPKGDSVIESSGKGVEFHQGKTKFGDVFIEKSDKETINPTKIATKGDVLLSVRAPVGPVNLLDRNICLGRGLCGITPLAGMKDRFIFYFLKAIENSFVKKATGTTFIAINADVIKNELIPIPPLEEQQRIVEKLEELLPLCEQLTE